MLLSLPEFFSLNFAWCQLSPSATIKSARSSALCPWQPDHKLSESPLFRFHGNLAFVLLHDDIIADRQAQSRALACRLRGEKGIENLVANAPRNAIAIVANADFDLVTVVFCG